MGYQPRPQSNRPRGNPPGSRESKILAWLDGSALQTKERDSRYVGFPAGYEETVGAENNVEGWMKWYQSLHQKNEAIFAVDDLGQHGHWVNGQFLVDVDQSVMYKDGRRVYLPPKPTPPEPRTVRGW